MPTDAPPADAPAILRLPRVAATRYVTPLREGGSLPGLMEADDLGMYVVKFRGAGQGLKALVADIVGTGLARALGLPVPQLALVEVDPALAAGEPDEEVQDLLRASAGLNLGVDFLPGSLDLDPAAFALPAGFAGRVLWFDALVGNVDRSWRNPNMLFWHGKPYLIDHGAALTFHHSWSGFDPQRVAQRPYDAGEHALLGAGPDLDAADTELAPRVTAGVLDAVLAGVPDEWLDGAPRFPTPDEVRGAYRDALLARITARDEWVPGLRAAVASGGSVRVPTDRTGQPSRALWRERP